jgi:hypothetical protein
VWAVYLAAHKLLQANRTQNYDTDNAIGVLEAVAQNCLAQFSINAIAERRLINKSRQTKRCYLVVS